MKVVLPVVLLFCASTVAGAQRPNILVILADDLGYSDLGCMGGDAETPHLDTLAQNGILFPNFYPVPEFLQRRQVCTEPRLADDRNM